MVAENWGTGFGEPFCTAVKDGITMTNEPDCSGTPVEVSAQEKRIVRNHQESGQAAAGHDLLIDPGFDKSGGKRHLFVKLDSSFLFRCERGGQKAVIAR
jgi:hypothetical protein